MESFVIKTPSSSANIGPGFDVIGLALTVYLELRVTIDRSKTASSEPLNCRITYEGQGEDDISLDPQANLITRVALYVLRCHDQRAFPVETHVHIKNPIPLGRGLGSSGAAVVAGVLLGKEVGGLHHLDNDRLFDYCLMIERHPDNVGAALFGGFVGTYLMPLKPEDVARIEIPLSEVLPSPAGGVDTGKKPPEPPVGIGHHIKFPWSKEIKAVAIIPDFVVPTHEARAVLPDKYARQDVTFNLQRIALLPVALGMSPPDPELIHLAMQDRVHQPYRQTLIPGLSQVVESMSPKTQPGFLGVCLSGAGPTILALATSNFEEIANKIIATLREHNQNKELPCEWKVLEPAEGTHLQTISKMPPVPPPKGVWVPVPTFFKSKSATDFDPVTPPLDLDAQAEHGLGLARSGIVGLVVFGSTGEGVHIHPRDRKVVLRSLADRFAQAGFPNYPLMAGTATNSIEETVEQLVDASSTGAQWGLCLAPGYNAPVVSQEGILLWFTAVANASPIPILIYHYPGVSNNVKVAPSTFAALAKHPNIVGCKLSHGDISQLTQIALNPDVDASGFHVYTGLGQQLLPATTVGCVGAIDGSAGFFPKSLVRLYNLSCKNHVSPEEEAERRQLQYRVSCMEEIVVKHGVVGIKEAVSRLRGIGDRDGTRLPMHGGIPGGDEEWVRWLGVLNAVEEFEVRL
ncbi:homoserine kinase [Purpureocillium lavendulum]|uniref:Homoserine kinase n=1 Tax=Purpureocillium lavendulum TaxID=1247861 RepID=A0AB34FPD8_9HYPO|nr:homoserine kinase [Purpureocillium lavendulum]